MRTKVALLAVAAAALAACAATGGATRSELLAAVPHEMDEAGEPIVVVRDYAEDAKIDGQDVRRRVQYAWNYGRGVAQERVWVGEQGEPTVRDDVGLVLHATEPEMEFAYRIVREDPRLAKRVPADALFYGGFIFRSANATPCGMRSRCVHVFATRDHGRHMDVHAIVDLMRARVVITDADPAMGGIADPVKKGG